MNRRSLFKKLGVVAAVVAGAPALVAEANDAPQAVVLDAEPRVVVNTHSYMAWQMEPLTFDDLRAGCEAGGCHLEHQYSIERLRHEYVHWRDGDQWADNTLTTPDRDLEPVAAWLDGLHERIDREDETKRLAAYLAAGGVLHVPHVANLERRT